MARGRGAAGALGLIRLCLILLCLIGQATATPHPTLIRARALEGAAETLHATFDVRVHPQLRVAEAPLEARWISPTDNRPFNLQIEPLTDAFRLHLRLDPPPVGAGTIALVFADGTHRISATWLPAELRGAVRLRGQLSRMPRHAAGQRAAVHADARAILAALAPSPWVQAEGALLDAALTGARLAEAELQHVATDIAQNHPSVAAWMMRVVAQHLGRAGHFHRAGRWAAHARKTLPPVDQIGAHLQAALEAQMSLWHGQYTRALQQIDTALTGATALGDGGRQFHYAQLKTDVLAGLGAHLDAVALAETLHAQAPSSATAVGRDWQLLDAMRRCVLPPRYAMLTDDLAATAFDPAQSRWVRQAASINGLVAAIADEDGAAADRLAVEAVRLNSTGPWVALSARLAADRARQRGDWDAARAGYEAVLKDAARRFGGIATDESWQALHGLGKVAQGLDSPGLSLLFFEAALTALDEASQAATARQHRADWFADRLGLVHAAARAALDLGLTRHAIRLLDRYRAPATRALLEDSRTAGLSPALSAAWTTQLEAYEHARAAHLDQVADCEGAALDDRRCTQALRSTSIAITRRFDEAHAWLDRVAPPLLPSALPRLDPGEAAVLQVEFSDSKHCDQRWTYSAFLTHDTAEIAPTGATIAHWLPRLRQQRHVFLVGDDPALIALPQQAVDAPDGPVWGEAIGLSFVPSLGWIDRVPRATAERPLAVIDPDGSVQHPMPAVLARSPRVLRGAQATRSAVLGAVSGAPWFVFDGHGVVQGDAWSAHLTLADGPLTVGDVLARRPAIGTAVLSGCESAVGARWSRTERMGLADAFVLGGANAVLATDIKVPVADAARFVEAFVRADGLAHPGAGYRAAVGKLRKAGDSAWRHWRLFGRP